MANTGVTNTTNTDLTNTSIEKLGDTNLTLANPDADIRGRDVVDKNGDKIGSVDALFIDTVDHNVRFIQVASGGFLGIGQDHVLVPVDAITNITPDQVQIDQTREHISGAPTYDPDLVADQNYWGGLYGYYGYSPYWAPGYVYPPYPYYPY